MVVQAMDGAVQSDERSRQIDGGADEGYMLLGLIVAIAILLLWLGAAASYEAFQIRRDREVEAARRADQYVRAIRLYYKKFGHYPGSIEQLEKSNNIRFLRRRWIDPLTKTADWRLISVGQNKTTVKGFFGEPLAGLPTTGLGALAGSQSAGMSGATAPASPGGATGSFGSASAGSAPAGGLGSAPQSGIGTLGSGSAGAATSAGSSGSAAGTDTATATAGAAGGTSATGTSGASSGGANSLFGAGNGLGGTNGAIMGVGTNATGRSILEVNEQTNYHDWEFLYDPRVELLRQKQQLNQGLQSSGAGSFGQSSGFGAPTNAPGAPTGGVPTAPNNNLPGGNQDQQNPGLPTTQPTVGVPVQQ